MHLLVLSSVCPGSLQHPSPGRLRGALLSDTALPLLPAAHFNLTVLRWGGGGIWIFPGLTLQDGMDAHVVWSNLNGVCPERPEFPFPGLSRGLRGNVEGDAVEFKEQSSAGNTAV